MFETFFRDYTNTQLANDCHTLGHWLQKLLVNSCVLVKIFFLNYELGNLNKPLKGFQLTLRGTVRENKAQR